MQLFPMQNLLIKQINLEDIVVEHKIFQISQNKPWEWT
uniref:Uncharacterized protein n=1 Tax=viral metagenome TaxID=1070528 RepID=A0A6C0JZN4_9ZZZZ